MSDCPMLISNKLHSFRNFVIQTYSTNNKQHTTFKTNTNIYFTAIYLQIKNKALPLHPQFGV